MADLFKICEEKWGQWLPCPLYLGACFFTNILRIIETQGATTTQHPPFARFLLNEQERMPLGSHNFGFVVFGKTGCYGNTNGTPY